MKAFANVWVHADAPAPAGDALAAAVQVCARSGATLTVLATIGRSRERSVETSVAGQVRSLIREQHEARLRALEARARDALPAPERVRAVALEGEVPWHAIAAHAAEHAPDLLVVAGRAAAPGGFDSSSQHLFRKCSAPVWSVHPGPAPFPRRALVAVDPNEAGSHERLLARRVLDVASRLADGGPLDLHVASAWSVPSEEVVRASIGEASTQAYAATLQANARREMDELLAEAGLTPAPTVHLPKGDPASAIPALAEELGADLVLLGSAGRTGLAGLFIGSTAEAIIAHLARSVLVVKPPGFVSPVWPTRDERATPVRTLS